MKEFYESPFSGRYGGEEMKRNFSQDRKYGLWRKLWLALAESQQEEGLDITDLQLNEMRAHLNDVNYEQAESREKEVCHDVMAHIYAFGLQCPSAKPVIHLGATSCFVTDNGELIQIYDALKILAKKLAAVMRLLAEKAQRYKDLPVTAYTHFQAAQFTTLGKRFALYLQDLAADAETVCGITENFRLRSAKGTTGTQASFLELFNGDAEKVFSLEKRVAEKMGFDGVFAVTGQTYPRKFDYKVLSALSGIAQSASKFATDLRLSQSVKELEEPFASKQVGSSAMAYKRNPVIAERICSLSRYLISLPANCAVTAGSQWFERSLDDSADRRIVIAEAFLCADEVLTLYADVVKGLNVNDKVIERRVKSELPFIMTENILMEAVKLGGDRQTLHEAIRRHSLEVSRRIKEDGAPNDLIDRLKKDQCFAPYKKAFDCVSADAASYVGLSAKQTENYLTGEYADIYRRLQTVSGGLE